MCGIVGTCRAKPGGIDEVRMGCERVNNRGNESIGIAGFGPKGDTHFLQPGYARDACNPTNRVWREFIERTQERQTALWLGQTRYKTVGPAGVELGQPLKGHHSRFGRFYLVHNGQLPNHAADRRALAPHYQFAGESDSETLVARIAVSSATTIEDAVAEIVRDVPGGFALLVMTEDTIVAATDRYWTRPLFVAVASDQVSFASEIAALPRREGVDIHALPKGTIGVARRSGQIVSWEEWPISTTTGRHFCLFEGLYFGRPDQVIGNSVLHMLRQALGRRLAQVMPTTEVDVWCGVPDTGNESGLGLATELGQSFSLATIMKNWYSTRSRAFMQPDQQSREAKVRQKYNISSMVKGMRVGVADDTLVRSTTARVLSQMLFEAGAIEVHWRIAAAPIIARCFTGIDIPTLSELAAAGLPPDSINGMVNGMIGATSLFYLPYTEMMAVADQYLDGWCSGCFTGTYPQGLVPVELLAPA